MSLNSPALVIWRRNFFNTYSNRSPSPTVTSTRYLLQWPQKRNDLGGSPGPHETVSGSLSLGVDDRRGGLICQHPCLTRVLRASRFTPPFPARRRFRPRSPVMRRLFPATLLAAVVPCLSLAAQAADTLPLKPTRAVDFTTSEGTWISLDLSPDGRTLVFELLGDLYTLPVSGGEAKRITSGPAFDSQPRYSPDGKRIVFLSDRSGAENIWLCDPDGSHPKALTKGTTNLYASPEWTPDGNYIVSSRVTGVLGSVYELWLYHKDGGSGTAMLKNPPPAPGIPAMNTLGAAFGKDPRYVWVSRHRGGFGYNLMYPLWELSVYDRQTGKLFGQTDLFGSAMRPVLSPDGKWLVYATRYDTKTGLRLRDLQTGDEKWLAYPVTRDDAESRFTRDVYPGSAFTPDSKAIITSYGGKIWRVDVPTGQATNIPFTAKVSQDLGPLVRFDTRVDTAPMLVREI